MAKVCRRNGRKVFSWFSWRMEELRKTHEDGFTLIELMAVMKRSTIPAELALYDRSVCKRHRSSAEGVFFEVQGELLRIIDNARRAALWSLSPPKPYEQNLLVPLVGWQPTENLSQRSSCSARRSLAKWMSLDRPKQKWTKRRERCSRGRRTGGLESDLGCWSAGRS